LKLIQEWTFSVSPEQSVAGVCTAPKAGGGEVDVVLAFPLRTESQAVS
jgi:hypothetical protein